MASFVTRFFGRTVSEGAAYALGVATGPVLAPATELIRQEAWTVYPDRVPDVGSVAEGVSQGKIDVGRAHAWASRHGFSTDVLDALVLIADTAPAIAQSLTLARRGIITPAELRVYLKRTGLSNEYLEPLAQLADVILTPAEAANAWQQGFMSEAEATAEARASGINPARSLIQRELAGNPPGPMDGLALLRRNLIDEGQYRQLVREGRTKTKYTDPLLALKNQVLGARDYAELWLRGWISEAEAKQGGLLTGYDADAMQKLYLNRGRPATPRQVWLAIRRNAPGKYGRADFDKAIRQSNIRTEYSDLLWSQRYTYPSLFQLSRLVQAGALSVARGVEILGFLGYEQTDIDAFDSYWKRPSTGGTAKWADRARSRLYTIAHNEYLDGSIDDAAARTLLTTVGVPAAEQTQVIAVWTAELGINRLELTPAQVKKAYKKNLYSEAEALAELEQRGMTPDDASTYLAS